MARPTEVTVSISTSSQEIPSTTPLPEASFPQITLNGVEIPQPSFVPRDLPSGFQIVVMNSAGDFSDPANIIANDYEPVWPDNLNGWDDTYRFMYENLVNGILGAGDPQQQLVFVASYGLDLGMFPTAVTVETLLNLGAGPQLQQWINTSSPSESGDWVDYPVDYAMIGGSAYGYGQATEKFDYAGGEGNPVKTSISVTLTNNPEPPTSG
jgi:hypothetical protein